MNALIQLVDVAKRYADTPALHSTNLSIERGTTTVLIGPSGCGKSTLLRLIIGLVEPDSGTIDFDGSPMTHDKIDVLRGMNISITTTAKTDDEAKALLAAFKFPFRN